MAELNPFFMVIGIFIGMVIGIALFIKPLDKFLGWIADKLWG